MSYIPKYIEQRIRRDIPKNSHVIKGSTPVVSFGNASMAKIATLGINPSRVEFLDKNGSELVDPSRRLATLNSLNVKDLRSASIRSIRKVLSDCNSYFERNPYHKWFDQLEQILKPCGGSYYDGTACHLDLVQWATDPTWRGIKSKKVRDALIEADATFLTKQLSKENIKLVLVNGNGVLSELKKRIDTNLKEYRAIELSTKRNVRIYAGSILDGVQVIAWTVNLQSSFGVSKDFRAELARRVGSLVKHMKI